MVDTSVLEIFHNRNKTKAWQTKHLLSLSFTLPTDWSSFLGSFITRVLLTVGYTGGFCIPSFHILFISLTPTKYSKTYLVMFYTYKIIHAAYMNYEAKWWSEDQGTHHSLSKLEHPQNHLGFFLIRIPSSFLPEVNILFFLSFFSTWRRIINVVSFLCCIVPLAFYTWHRMFQTSPCYCVWH